MAEAYGNRGNAFFKEGNLSQAIADYTRVIAINPLYARIYNNRGLAYYSAKDYAKAWADVHQAEKLGSPVNGDFILALKRASGQDK